MLEGHAPVKLWDVDQLIEMRMFWVEPNNKAFSVAAVACLADIQLCRTPWVNIAVGTTVVYSFVLGRAVEEHAVVASFEDLSRPTQVTFLGFLAVMVTGDLGEDDDPDVHLLGNILQGTDHPAQE